MADLEPGRGGGRTGSPPHGLMGQNAWFVRGCPCPGPCPLCQSICASQEAEGWASLPGLPWASPRRVCQPARDLSPPLPAKARSPRRPPQAHTAPGASFTPARMGHLLPEGWSLLLKGSSRLLPICPALRPAPGSRSSLPLSPRAQGIGGSCWWQPSATPHSGPTHCSPFPLPPAPSSRRVPSLAS